MSILEYWSDGVLKKKIFVLWSLLQHPEIKISLKLAIGITDFWVKDPEKY